jgi:hypothetical protein
MFGDLQGAMELATKALPLARSRDEVSPSLLPLSVSMAQPCEGSRGVEHQDHDRGAARRCS